MEIRDRRLNLRAATWAPSVKQEGCLIKGLRGGVGRLIFRLKKKKKKSVSDLSCSHCCCSQIQNLDAYILYDMSHIGGETWGVIWIYFKVCVLTTEQLCSRVCFRAQQNMWKSSCWLLGTDPQPFPTCSFSETDESQQFLSHLSSCDLLLKAYLCLQTLDRIITNSSADRPSTSRRWWCLAQVPTGTRDLMPLWLQILALCQYLVVLLLICWNIALLRKTNICSSLISILGCGRKVVISASYRVPKNVSNCYCFFFKCQLVFLLGLLKIMYVCITALQHMQMEALTNCEFWGVAWPSIKRINHICEVMHIVSLLLNIKLIWHLWYYIGLVSKNKKMVNNNCQLLWQGTNYPILFPSLYAHVNK